MCSVKMRQKVEKEIADKVIECLLNAGYIICVNDGEEDVTEGGIKDPEEIKKAMFSTDEDILFVYSNENDLLADGYVHFIYGNDGYDVIHDYTTNLESILKPATALADTYW